MSNGGQEGSEATKRTGGTTQMGSTSGTPSPSQVADQVKHKATDLAHDAGDKASEIGSQAANSIDNAMTATGERMADLSRRVRENAPEGQIGDVAQNAADMLERGGSYLQQADLGAVRGDLETIIRRYPVESLLVGVGVGYLLARNMRR